MRKTHIEVTVPTTAGDRPQVCANVSVRTLFCEAIRWGLMQWDEPTIFCGFVFVFFSLLITAQTEAACRKRGRADKNEEGQPFYAFTEQICRITHASSTCLKRQCSISFVCFGLGVSFLLFFLNQSCHVLGLEVWWLKWPMSSVREAPPIKAKANGRLGAVSLKGSLHPLHFPTPMSQTFHSLVVAVAHPHRTALRSTHWVNFLICQFVDPARTTF